LNEGGGACARTRLARLIRAANRGARAFVHSGDSLDRPESKRMASRRSETANLQVFHGRGWVRTSDLSRVRRSTSRCKSCEFAGGNGNRTARPSPSGHHEFQGIRCDLGQRSTSLAQTGGVPGDRVNLCSGPPKPSAREAGSRSSRKAIARATSVPWPLPGRPTSWRTAASWRPVHW
jgi:hypothetical protein